MEVETALGIGELFVGRLLELRERFERRHKLDLQEISDAQRIRYHVRYLSDRIVDVCNTLSHAQWLTGAPDTALCMARASVEHARNTKHHLSLGNALSWVCPVFSIGQGHYQECSRYVAMLDDQARRHSFDIRRPVAMFYRAALACSQDDLPEGAVDDVERAIAQFHATGHLARLPYYLSVLAQMRCRQGRLGDAELAITTALDRARAKNDRWCLPEVVRVEASVRSAAGRTDEAERLLLTAIALAQETGAAFLAAPWRLPTSQGCGLLIRGRTRLA